MIKPGQTLTRSITFNVQGVPTDATGMPVAVLLIGGTENGASVTVEKKDTARYLLTCLVPEATPGQSVEFMTLATVDGVDTMDVLFAGYIDTKRVSDLRDALAAPTLNAIVAAFAAALPEPLDLDEFITAFVANPEMAWMLGVMCGNTSRSEDGSALTVYAAADTNRDHALGQFIYDKSGNVHRRNVVRPS